jgi:outer membrane lipase/esterase
MHTLHRQQSAQRRVERPTTQGTTMKNLRNLALCAVAIAVLAACGGGGDDTTTPTALESAASRGPARASFTRLVSFGDSLSDVGSYRTPGVAGLGGGQYTVNSGAATNWTEVLARKVEVQAPCAAQTGLESIGPLAGLSAPITNHAGCFAYGQGGARVTDPIGIANKGVLLAGNTAGALGQLTDPIVNQIGRHLAATGGRFDGRELVTVLGGGNDLFVALETLQATLAAGGDPAIAVPAAFTAVATAGAELAFYVKNMIVGNGARRVVVVNLPDIGTSPSATDGTRELITALVTAFNTQLANGVAGTNGVLLVDAFAASQDQAAHPARYGLLNVTTPACDFSRMVIPSSLVCSTSTVVAGPVLRYLFADTVHPTPYGYRLLARTVAASMRRAAWLDTEKACDQLADDAEDCMRPADVL